MTLKQLISLVLLSIYVVACGNESEPIAEVNTATEEIVADKMFVSDTLLIDPNLFPVEQQEAAMRLLEQAKICTTDSNDMQMVLCDPKWFRLWPLGPEKPLEEGFICESRSLMFNGGISRNCLVLKPNKDGKWQRVNHWLGKLLEFRSKENGYYDIVMSYKDSDIGWINVLHQWTEPGFYDRIEVIELNDFKVKKEAKDSLFEVYLKEFRWGY